MTTDQQLKTCPFCAEEILAVAIKCKHCGEYLNIPPATQLPAKDEISQIANLEKINCYIGISIAVIMCFTVVYSLLGIIYLVIMVNRLKKLVPRIEARDQTVPKEYEPLFGIIFFTILFVCIGAFLILPIQALEFIIRDKVLKNRHLFTENLNTETTSSGESNE